MPDLLGQLADKLLDAEVEILEELEVEVLVLIEVVTETPPNTAKPGLAN